MNLFNLNFRRSGFRPLPDYLIIGAQKAGTSALHGWLVRQPGVSEPRRKEVHYFSLYYDRGKHWYRDVLDPQPGELCGEASPIYLFHPEAPSRVLEHNPHVRIIALLREPAERAWSQYRMNVGRGDEKLSFAEALEKEDERLSRELRQDPRAYDREGSAFQNHSYLSRGAYATQLKRWMGLFPREQFLVLKAEEVFANPVPELNKVIDFLGLKGAETESYKPEFRGPSGDLPQKEATWIRERLANEMEELNILFHRQFF